MAALRWKTTERRIGIVGPRWSGKTVLLTALINHLKFHDPNRFAIGSKKRPGEVSHFREINDHTTDGQISRLPWFDYEGYRNQLVQKGSWPAATKDISEYRCEFERSDWKFSLLRLHLLDLPGERVNDIPMITGEKDTAKAYVLWADRTAKRLEKDLQLSHYFQPFFKLSCQPDATLERVIHEYKLALAKSRAVYRPYITPSTFLLDRQGVRIKGTDATELANNRYCGIAPDQEFVPLSIEARTAHPDWASLFTERFDVYCQQVLIPVVRGLKTSHSLVIMVDVLNILAHGPGMYEDYRQLIADLLHALNPTDNTLDLMLRNFYENFLPVGLRRSWINRIAFVAPKMDRIPFEDRARVKNLMEQLVRHDAKNCRGIDIQYFPVASITGARENLNGQREMIGCTLYDSSGKPLQPGVEQKFTVPPIPDVWPEHGWKAGDYTFPDVYPRVSPLANCPTEQTGLDSLFDFLCR